MKDFLGVSTEEFLPFVYTALLRRNLDAAGKITWVPRKDKWHERIRVVVSIADSPEGKSRKVKFHNISLWRNYSKAIQVYKMIFNALRAFRRKLGSIIKT